MIWTGEQFDESDRPESARWAGKFAATGFAPTGDYGGLGGGESKSRRP